MVKSHSNLGHGAWLSSPPLHFSPSLGPLLLWSPSLNMLRVVELSGTCADFSGEGVLVHSDAFCDRIRQHDYLIILCIGKKERSKRDGG